MTERLKWADVIIAMANGETGQWLHVGGKWVDGVDYNPMSYPEYEWRVKPKTIKIGDMEVPEPLRVVPEKDATYFIVEPMSDDLFYAATWGCDNIDIRHLSRGQCHATEEAAIAHAKALIKVSGGTIE